MQNAKNRVRRQTSMLKIGMLTSGGDCQGLNAALRGVAKTLYNELGDKITIYGIRDGYRGLIEGDYHEMLPEDFSDILTVGGTILGTSRQPFKEMRKTTEDSEETKLDKMLHTVKKAGFDCLVILGGNGTHKTANLLSMKGVNVVTLPKTIDNDLWGTELTFGFQSAIDIASTVIDSIHSTAFSHSRVFIVEVMGHKAGWIALYSGMAGGGDVILVPEIPYNIKNIGDTILNRLKKGKPYSIVVVAEGIQTDGRKRAAEYIAQEIEYETGIETRETVLGYIQRGGSPTPFDRNLSTRMGGHATELIANGQFGRMIALKGDEISSVALEEVAGKLKLVTEEHDLVVQGRRMGICFG